MKCKGILLKNCLIDGDRACKALEVEDLPLELHPESRIYHDWGVPWIHLEVEVAE
jgi:hypothetical protein